MYGRNRQSRGHRGTAHKDTYYEYTVSGASRHFTQTWIHSLLGIWGTAQTDIMNTQSWRHLGHCTQRHILWMHSFKGIRVIHKGRYYEYTVSRASEQYTRTYHEYTVLGGIRTLHKDRYYEYTVSRASGQYTRADIMNTQFQGHQGNTQGHILWIHSFKGIRAIHKDRYYEYTVLGAPGAPHTKTDILDMIDFCIMHVTIKWY